MMWRTSRHSYAEKSERDQRGDENPEKIGTLVARSRFHKGVKLARVEYNYVNSRRKGVYNRRCANDNQVDT